MSVYSEFRQQHEEAQEFWHLKQEERQQQQEIRQLQQELQQQRKNLQLQREASSARRLELQEELDKFRQEKFSQEQQQE